MSRSRTAVAVLLFAALVLPLRPADAGSSLLCTGYSSCSDKGYSHHGYSSKQSTSYWRMYTGTNCTNYVAYRMVKTGGMPNVRPRAGVGNAKDWGTAMASATDRTPSVGSVAWWGKTGNHVAYVEKVVSSSEIWVSESNWSGAFDWRRITKSGSGWPDGFIHFTDLKIVNRGGTAIVGKPKVGVTLTAAAGDWMPKGNTYSYRWYAGGKAISGATAKKFTPTAAQLDATLTAKVTAARPSYPTAKATSPGVRVKAGTLRATADPTIDGTPRIDEVLHATAGTWSPVATTHRYQWLVDGKPVASATAASFKPRPEDVDSRVTVQVTAARAGYADETVTSDPTTALSPGSLASTARPTISGTPRVGTPLTATPGSWSRSGLTHAYQWLVDGTAVPGATGPTFVPRAEDTDRPVSVTVTAARTGYTPATATSHPTSQVGRGILTVTQRPTVSGKHRVGSRLVSTPGTWSHRATLTYQWYADGRPIDGATASSLIPTHRERGHKLRLRVTGRLAGFSTVTTRSVNTPVIDRGRITVSRTPVVTGSNRLGSLLMVDRGTYTPSGATVRYQWLRDGAVLPGATGRTHRVKTGDLDHRLSVRVSYAAPGHTTSTLTTPRLGRSRK